MRIFLNRYKKGIQKEGKKGEEEEEKSIALFKDMNLDDQIAVNVNAPYKLATSSNGLVQIRKVDTPFTTITKDYILLETGNKDGSKIRYDRVYLETINGFITAARIGKIVDTKVWTKISGNLHQLNSPYKGVIFYFNIFKASIQINESKRTNEYCILFTKFKTKIKNLIEIWDHPLGDNTVTKNYVRHIVHRSLELPVVCGVFKNVNVEVIVFNPKELIKQKIVQMQNGFFHIIGTNYYYPVFNVSKGAFTTETEDVLIQIIKSGPLKVNKWLAQSIIEDMGFKRRWEMKISGVTCQYITGNMKKYGECHISIGGRWGSRSRKLVIKLYNENTGNREGKTIIIKLKPYEDSGILFHSKGGIADNSLAIDEKKYSSNIKLKIVLPTNISKKGQLIKVDVLKFDKLEDTDDKKSQISIMARRMITFKFKTENDMSLLFEALHHYSVLPLYEIESVKDEDLVTKEDNQMITIWKGNKVKGTTIEYKHYINNEDGRIVQTF